MVVTRAVRQVDGAQIQKHPGRAVFEAGARSVHRSHRHRADEYGVCGGLRIYRRTERVVVEFAAVFPPSRPIAAGVGDLPAAMSRWEWLHVDFPAVADLIRAIGDPLAIW